MEGLNLTIYQRIVLVYWPLLSDGFLHAFGLAFVLAFGDLTVVAFFNNGELTTLSYYLYELLLSYKIKEALFVGGLMLISIALLFLCLKVNILKGKYHVRN